MKINIKLFYIISFLQTLVFTTAIWSFFFTSYLNFSFGQGLFLITIVGIVSTIFEVPSGARADRFGRKKMFIIGILLLIINITFWCIAKSFISFIIAGIIAGIGYAILSGNLEALIHDGLEDEKNEIKFKDIAANSYIFLFLGRAFASGISGILFVKNPLLPVYLTLISTILILICSIFLNEPNQILSKHKDNIAHLKESMNFLIKNNLILIFIIILSILSGLLNIYFFTQQPYFNQLGFSIEFIGFIFTIGALFAALGSYIFKIISSKYSNRSTLNILLIMGLISCILFIMFSKIYAIMGLIIISTIGGMIMTFGNNYLIHKVPKHQKSTILSIFSLFITIGYSGFNILISLTISYLGLHKIYFITILLSTILIIINLLIFNKNTLKE